MLRAAARGVLALLRSMLLAAFIVALLGVARPLLQHGIYVARLLAAAPPAALAHPVPGARGRLQDTWHAPRRDGRRHEGIDIFAARGTPVRSTTEGVVLRRGRNRLGGKVVWVLGPGGHRHYYAHLDGYSPLRTGERIAAGTTLGYVGDSGNARGTPPHLHYGIYTPSGPVNPYPLLRSGRPDRAGPEPGRD